MSEPTTERLYNLLPAIYRIRDADQGEPLRALLQVLEGELLAVQGDIEALYDDWFIETCAEWVVPYIGDLVGARGLLPTGGQAFSQRGRVANALAQRRGKGTATALAQLAHDATGWPARVVEFFGSLAAAQHVNHIRPGLTATLDLRDTNQLELLGGPFEVAAHTPDIRSVAATRGKYNVPHLGIFLWRLQGFALAGGTAREVSATRPEQQGRYTFNALGLDAPLFNLARTDQAAEAGLPGPLRRRALHDASAAYFGVDPVLQVRVQLDPNGPVAPVAADDLAICDLSDAAIPEGWRRPTAPVRVAVDPELGRLALPNGVAAARVEVDYVYGFSGSLGGGPYNQRDAIDAWLGDSVPDIELQVGGATTFADAVAEWNSQPPGTVGTITFVDSHTHTGNQQLVIPVGSRLLLAASNRQRPHVLGDIGVRGTAPADALTPGALCVNGLLVEGNLSIAAGNLLEVRVSHTTLAPIGGRGMVSADANDRLEINVERSIIGAVRVADSVPRVRLVDSIVDGVSAGGAAIVASALGVDGSTVIGATSVDQLDASNSIFTTPVGVVRRQVGCVRFSFVPRGSLVPRRFQCQPTDGSDAPRIAPRFTSVTYGQPGYAQLASTCPPEIMAGADDEGEMGAFHFLQQTQRIRSLEASLEEHVRFGLEAGLFLVT